YVTLFSIRLFRLFFFTRSSTLKLYSRSLHDALPISRSSRPCGRPHRSRVGGCVGLWSLGCGVDPSGSVGDPGQDPARGAARCDRAVSDLQRRLYGGPGPARRVSITVVPSKRPPPRPRRYGSIRSCRPANDPRHGPDASNRRSTVVPWAGCVRHAATYVVP